MTGIERLRNLIDAVDSSNTLWSITSSEYDQAHGFTSRNSPVLRDVLADVADQIEREHNIADKEEHDAATWVREHGGLEMVSLDFAEGMAFGDIVDDVAARLGASVEGLDSQDARDRIMSALDHRLMPEGMEWPRVDGKPVDFKTAYAPSLGVLEAVSIYSTGACEVMSHDGIIKGISEIHIVAPKALDADGVEIRVGDTVYALPGKWCNRWPCFGMDAFRKMTVETLTNGRNDGSITCGSECLTCYPQPSQLTHRAPVLAADGRPLREGETVWHEDGTELKVLGFLHEEDDETIVKVEPVPGPTKWCECRSLSLTHERPDTWERLEEDAGKNPFDYCKHVGHKLDTCENSEAYKARDLVRRAKALAERDR